MTQLDMLGGGEDTATFSEDGRYRYDLTRRWGWGGRRVVWVMLNPSTADASRNDPTIRRCIGYSKRWGFDELVVCNLFAYRSTDPDGLLEVDDPIGPANAEVVGARMLEAELVVCAWGAFVARLAHRGVRRIVPEAVAAECGIPVVCLGTTDGGHPRHPLYVAASQPFVPFPQ